VHVGVLCFEEHDIVVIDVVKAVNKASGDEAGEADVARSWSWDGII